MKHAKSHTFFKVRLKVGLQWKKSTIVVVLLGFALNLASCGIHSTNYKTGSHIGRKGSGSFEKSHPMERASYVPRTGNFRSDYHNNSRLSGLNDFHRKDWRALNSRHRDVNIKYEDDPGCPEEFGNRCDCLYQHDENDEYEKIKYYVNCTDTLFSDIEVLRHLPINTEVLIFTGNMIPVLQDYVFGLKSLPKLREVDFSNNEIQEIRSFAFDGISSIKRLILNNNKISNLSLQEHHHVFSPLKQLEELQLSNAFDKNIWMLTDLAEIFVQSNLTKLERLHLENNNIGFINNRTVFCQLPALMDLHLANNELNDFDMDTSCFKQLRYVELARNKIHTISDESALYSILDAKNKIGNLIVYNLMGNPFVCDCNLKPFLHWFKNWTQFDQNRVPDSSELICNDGLPKNNTGKRLKDVNYTECPLLQASHYSSTMARTVQWIIGITLTVGVIIALYVHRAFIFRNLSPILNKSPDQVKYISIDDKSEDVEPVDV